MGAGRDLFGLRKDGSEFPVEIGLNPIKLDDELFVLGAVTDITEREQLSARLAEQAQEIKQSEDKMRLTFEASPGGLLLANEAGTIHLANAQIEQMFGGSLGPPISAESFAIPLAEMVVPTAPTLARLPRDAA